MRVKDPVGTARSDYRVKCPYCHTPPRTGDAVRKVGNRWWHEACRKAYRSTLGLKT